MAEQSKSEVRVQLRTTALADAAALETDGDGVFLAIDAPPPVGSVLTLHGPDVSRQIEVARVVEVPETDARKRRGLYGRDASETAKNRHEKVGSEHIAAGEAQHTDPATPSDERSEDDAGPTGHAMPAPVIEPETDEHEVPEGADAGSDSAEAGASGNGEAEGAGTPWEASASNEPAQASSEPEEAQPNKRRGKGKRRKGRRRR